MNTQNRILSFSSLLFLGLMAVVFVPTTATAVGTTAGDTLPNGLKPSGGTLPLASGQLSVEVVKQGGADTMYADTDSVVSTTVDTGFDIGTIGNPGGPFTVAEDGDSVAVPFVVSNLSNNAQPIPFSTEHLVRADSGVMNDSFTLDLYVADGDVSSIPPGATNLNTSGDNVDFAEGDTKTIFAVITSKDTGLVGDEVESDFFVTDNAPINGPGSNENNVVGDQWQDGSPINGVDSNDTQTFTFTTSISGPNIFVRKNVSLVAGSARPGDTVQYTITAWNDGDQASDTTTLVDAFPDSTVYVGGSDADTLAGNSINTASVFGTNSGSAFGFDDNFVQDGSSDEDSTDGVSSGELAPALVRIVLPLEGILAQVGGDGPNPTSDDTIQISYRVVIQ